MATFRVPQQTHQPGNVGAADAADDDAVHWHNPEPASVTQPGGGDAAQRNSISSTNEPAGVAAATAPPSGNNSAEPPANAATAPGSSTEMAPLAGAAAAGGAAAAASKAALPSKSPPVPTTGSRKQTYLQRHPEEERKGWSRGRKICCGLVILFAAILITIGVLIAFMVRVPSVDYKRSQILCENNNYLKCAQETIQIRVWLEVNNPNILGATINAELGLYKQDGTFLGPGAIDDVMISKRTVTEVTALFNITSNRGYDIVTALFIPPTHSVDLNVKGTVFVHVGLLRPSVQISQTFTVPPQDIVGLAGGIVGGLGGVPSTGAVVGAVGGAVAGAAPAAVNAGLGAIPSNAGSTVVGSIPGLGGVAGLVPSIPGVGSNRDSGAGAAGSGSGSSAAANMHPTTPPRPPKPQQSGAATPTDLSRANLPQQQNPSTLRRVNPTLFAQALLAVGAPNSLARQSFLLRQSQPARSRHTDRRSEMLGQRLAKQLRSRRP